MQVTKIKVWAWILLISVPLGNAIAVETPIGLWKTHDDKGVATGYVRINEENGILTGVI